ncbi:MAG TPA: glycosyltransferase family 87 protein [Acidobacteriaceae bacterium]|nr:glycosyltransferase family 87 protein [Acidobacteriaceae bacterium]
MRDFFRRMTRVLVLKTMHTGQRSIDLPVTRSVPFFVLAIVCVCISAVGIGGTIWITARSAPLDWLSYWASAHQLVRHQNPYGEAPILRLEQLHGFPKNKRAFMPRNTPNALFLMAPLGYLSAYAAGFVWRLTLIACVVGSMQLIWIILGRPRNRWYLIGYCFTPIFMCIVLGQSTLIALLGIVLFLRYCSEKPLLAGAALSLCAIKPHLFLVFGVVLLAWIILRRGYKLLAAFVAAVLVESVIPLYFDAGVWRHYLEMMRANGVPAQFRPVLASAVRFLIAPHQFWVQFIPALASCVWGIWYFRRHRNAWDWTKHAPLILLVSLAVAPYSGAYDCAILLPAILFALYQQEGISLGILLASICAASYQYLRGTSFLSPLYLWQSVFWLVWYLLPQILRQLHVGPNEYKGQAVTS